MRWDELFHSGGRPVVVLLEPEGEADEKGTLSAEGEEEPPAFILVFVLASCLVVGGTGRLADQDGTGMFALDGLGDAGHSAITNGSGQSGWGAGFLIREGLWTGG